MGAYTSSQRQTLLRIARDSIQHGLKHGNSPKIDASGLEPALTEKRATFVTLEIHGELRGCIGTLEAKRSLAQDVSENAYNAAFTDPRFPALSEPELPYLSIHISVLSVPELFPVRDEADLLQKLRPHIDGLLLEEGRHRATFLPAVWEDLTDPKEFVRHLKRKAGWKEDYWSSSIKVSRYTTESIS